jgi:hypothetical protein
MAGGFKSPQPFLGLSKGRIAGFLTPHPVFISKVGTSDAGWLGPLPVFFGASALSTMPVQDALQVKRILNFGFAGRRN